MLTHVTIDWNKDGDIFSTGFLPIKSSRSITPNAYTSLLSVSLPVKFNYIKSLKTKLKKKKRETNANKLKKHEMNYCIPSDRYSGAKYPEVPESFTLFLAWSSVVASAKLEIWIKFNASLGQ